MNIDEAIAHIDRTWAAAIVPALHEYIAIPNVSSAYDAEWAGQRAHGRRRGARVAVVPEPSDRRADGRGA